MVWHALRWAALGIALAPLGYYLLAMYAGWKFFHTPRESFSQRTPPVSILKPVRGLDREAYKNFASFCQQEYPQYEILFGVSEESDPAVPVIRKIISDFPRIPVRLVVGEGCAGANNKVNKLARLAREAWHDVLVIADSDIRVEPGYLREVVAPLADEKVGMVTCLYRGLAGDCLPSELEAIGNTADFAPGVLAAWLLEGVGFGLGATMATTKRHLAEIGGFEALANHYADDYELGKRVAERGYRVEIAPRPVETVYPDETLAECFAHQVRWAMTTLQVRPWSHLGLIFTFGLPWAVLAAGVASSWRIGAAYVEAYLVLRLGMAWSVGVQGLGDTLLRRRMWLLPVRDALAFAAWLVSFVTTRINWRGREFYVRKGILVPVADASEASAKAPANG